MSHSFFVWFVWKIIYIPGDNDIGGEGNDHVTQAKLDRFRTHFPSPEETVERHLDFISVNRILGDLNLVPEDPIAGVDFKGFRVVLSHIPLTFINGVFSKEVVTRLKPHLILSAHDHRLSVATTRLDDDTFTIHNELENPFHDDQILKKKLNDLECLEIMLPTCSYRMGVPKTGYGYLIVGTNLQRTRI